MMVLLVTLAHCGVEHRVSKNQGYYDRLSPEVRELINTGRIANGFETKSVFLAWGYATDKRTATTDAGTFETWMYVYSGNHEEKKRLRYYDPATRQYQTRDVRLKSPYLKVMKFVSFKDGFVIEHGAPDITYEHVRFRRNHDFCPVLNVHSPVGCAHVNDILRREIRRMKRLF